MRRPPPSLRRRLTFLVTGAVAGAVIVVGTVSYTASRSNLRRNLDSELLAGAQGQANAEKQASSQALQPNPTFFNRSGGTPTGGPRGPGGFSAYAQTITPAGQPTRIGTNGEKNVKTLPLDARDLAIAKSGTGTSFRDVTVSGQHLRLVTVGAGAAGAVQQARPLDDIDHTLHDLLLSLLITAGGGIILAAGIGVLVTRSSLRPVREISGAAQEVARTQDLSSLIPEVGPEEIADIARSVNSMLLALDHAKDRQRQLVDDTSHELRTPLTSLRTNIDLLAHVADRPDADKVLPPAERRQMLSDLQAQAVELSDLVTQLVELARYEAQPEEEVDVDVAAVIDRAVERARRRAPRVAIEADVAGGLVLRGRPGALERALVNLLDNAVKFGPADGVVTLEARDGLIQVTDQGPGIPAAERNRVFDRFYRAQSARKLPGSGLGLAMVAEAAKEHEGSVAAEAGPEGGARIVLRLPRLATR